MKFAEQLQQQVEDLRKLIQEQNDLYEKFQTRETKILNKWCRDHNTKW